jgi:hypothetical protein
MARLGVVLPTLGGTLAVASVQWRGSELLAAMPLVEASRVVVEPAHGGKVEVRTFVVATAPDAPGFPLPRRLRAARDGSFRFLPGQPQACAAIEELPSGSAVFRGFFVFDGARGDHRIALAGRWVDVVSRAAGDISMQARLLDLDVEWTVEVTRQPLRLWLPASVATLDYRTSSGSGRLAAADVGAVLLL